MKHVLWLDSVKEPPKSDDTHYYWAKSVYEAVDLLLKCEYPLKDYGHIEYIDVNYSAGDFVYEGGDYPQFLRFLACTGKNYPVRIHAEEDSQVAELREIIENNGWFEIGRKDTKTNRYIFHCSDERLLDHTQNDICVRNGDVCFATARGSSPFDKVEVVFKDGFRVEVYSYELELVIE